MRTFLILAFGILLQTSWQPTARASLPNEGPTQEPVSGLPTDPPTMAMPSVCQAGGRDAHIDNVISRTLTLSNLDVASCTYETVTSPVSDQEVQAACAAAVASHGVQGPYRCENTMIPGRIEVRVGCTFPAVVTQYQNYSVFYTRSESEYHQLQCQSLNDCLTTRLSDPRDFLLARQWQHQLGCQ